MSSPLHPLVSFQGSVQQNYFELKSYGGVATLRLNPPLVNGKTKVVFKNLETEHDYKQLKTCRTFFKFLWFWSWTKVWLTSHESFRSCHFYTCKKLLNWNRSWYCCSSRGKCSFTNKSGRIRCLVWSTCFKIRFHDSIVPLVRWWVL